jgi:site-specific recombinase XerD
MDRQSLNTMVKVLACAAGLNETHYSTHNFRIGVAMTALAAGVSDCIIYSNVRSLV